MDLTPWHVPRDELLAELDPLTPADLVSDDAVGLVAASEVRSRAPLPRDDVAAMDGVAVAADTTPGRLAVVGDLHAGAEPTRLQAGTAVHIATGAVLPAGADAVVRRERCRASGDHVEVPVVAPGDDVRRRGRELELGEVILDRGDVVTSSHLALLLAGEAPRVTVHPRPRVALVVTGEELAPAAPSPHAIPDLNGPVLAIRIGQLGGDVSSVEHVGDDLDLLRTTLRRAAASADLVIATGGTSVGRHDHLATALAGIGTSRSWRLALRPAKPLVTGSLGPTPVLGLPGNPNAARVSFELLVRPLLLRLAGRATHDGWQDETLTATVERNADGRTHVLAGWSREGGTVTPIGPADLRNLARADRLVLAPDGGTLAAGTTVETLSL